MTLSQRQALALLDRHTHCRQMADLAASHLQQSAMTAWAIKADHALGDLRGLIETGCFMTDESEDGRLIAALRADLDGLPRGDATCAADILARVTSLRRPLRAGWREEVREIITRRRPDTPALVKGPEFETDNGDVET